jgi:hypothetical protein
MILENVRFITFDPKGADHTVYALATREALDARAAEHYKSGTRTLYEGFDEDGRRVCGYRNPAQDKERALFAGNPGPWPSASVAPEIPPWAKRVG